jgi:hypothetical protein
MSSSHDKDPKSKDPQGKVPQTKDLQDNGSDTPAPDASTQPDRRRSGRAGFDERGNAVWEWQLETGVYSRDVSTQTLRKLELDELSIAETVIAPPAPAHKDQKALGGGSNPYDSAAQVRGSNPYDTARAKEHHEASTPARPRTPADMRALSDAIKRKNRK